jgi:MFS transporter, PAT family, beta-lactamase induction signal transducer AmpG
MWLEVFRSRRMAVLFVLGFSSGLPLYLTGSTLQAWLTSEHVPLERIAAFSVVGLAYTFKWAWAPLLDRYAWPFLGRRRGWVLVTQLGLVAAIAAMGMVDPDTQPVALAALAIAVAAFSASQDVVLDAYATDLLAPHERAAGSSVYVIGYRAAMMLTGTVALIMADHVSWRLIYTVMALLMGIGIIGTMFAEEPPPPAKRITLAEAVYLPIVELARRFGVRGMAIVLAFVAVYKFGDFFAQALLVVFLKSGSPVDLSQVPPAELPHEFAKAMSSLVVKRGAGFRFTDIALVYKLLGFTGIFIGGFAGGSLAARFGVRRMLIVFGVMQALTNLLYAWLAVTGKSYAIFGTAVLLDQLTGAMGTATFVAVQMSVCSPAVSATQYALLTSLTSVGQRVFGPLADNVVAAVGWSGFFACTSLMALPGLVLAALLPRDDRSVS